LILCIRRIDLFVNVIEQFYALVNLFDNSINFGWLGNRKGGLGGGGVIIIVRDEE
jgi:hypothetical protein